MGDPLSDALYWLGKTTGDMGAARPARPIPGLETNGPWVPGVGGGDWRPPAFPENESFFKAPLDAYLAGATGGQRPPSLDNPILPPTPPTATAPGATPVTPPAGPDYARTPGSFGPDGRFQKPGTPASGGPDRGPVTASPGDRGDEAAGRDTRNTAWIRDAGRPLVNDAPSNPSYFEPVDQGAAMARLQPDISTPPGQPNLGGGVGSDNGILFGGAGGGNHTMADLMGQIQSQEILNRLTGARDADLEATMRRDAAFDPTRRRIQSETDQLQLEQLLPVGEDRINADTHILATNDDGSGRMIDRELGPGYRKVGSESRVGSARASELSPASQREAAFGALGKLQMEILTLQQAAARGDKTAAAQADELQKHYDRKVEELKLYMPALLGRVLYPAEKADPFDETTIAESVRRQAAAQQQVVK